MRIKRRANGYWYAIKDGRFVTLKTRDKATAQRRAADLERAPRGDCVSDIMTAYLTDKAHKPGIAGMTDAANALLPFFGHLRPDQINRPLCRSYCTHRAGRSNGTIIKELSTLRAALRWSDRNSPAIFEMPREPEARQVYITKEQFLTMLNGVVMPHFRAYLALAWYTLARKEAILTLTWDRVNLDTRKLTYGGDIGNKGRVAGVPIHDELHKVLSVTLAGSVTNYVIEYGGKQVQDIKKAFASAASKAGLDITPHDIRRSGARHLIEQGIDMALVSQLLGHKDINVTRKHYGQFSPDYLKRAVEAL